MPMTQKIRAAKALRRARSRQDAVSGEHRRGRPGAQERLALHRLRVHTLLTALLPVAVPAAVAAAPAPGRGARAVRS